MTLVGQVFSLTVAGVAPIELVIGLEAFVTGGAIDIPPCEMIN
jgi:hypothetical protein